MNKENLPSIQSYCYYSSDNYGAHCMCVKIPRSRKNKYGITLYYSYSTLVAFRGFVDGEYNLFVIKNYWNNTTGKHLNAIDGGDKKTRLTENEFLKLYNKAIKNA